MKLVAYLVIAGVLKLSFAESVDELFTEEENFVDVYNEDENSRDLSYLDIDKFISEADDADLNNAFQSINKILVSDISPDSLRRVCEFNVLVELEVDGHVINCADEINENHVVKRENSDDEDASGSGEGPLEIETESPDKEGNFTQTDILDGGVPEAKEYDTNAQDGRSNINEDETGKNAAEETSPEVETEPAPEGNPDESASNSTIVPEATDESDGSNLDEVVAPTDDQAPGERGVANSEGEPSLGVTTNTENNPSGSGSAASISQGYIVPIVFPPIVIPIDESEENITTTVLPLQELTTINAVAGTDVLPNADTTPTPNLSEAPGADLPIDFSPEPRTGTDSPNTDEIAETTGPPITNSSTQPKEANSETTPVQDGKESVQVGVRTNIDLQGGESGKVATTTGQVPSVTVKPDVKEIVKTGSQPNEKRPDNKEGPIAGVRSNIDLHSGPDSLDDPVPIAPAKPDVKETNKPNEKIQSSTTGNDGRALSTDTSKDIPAKSGISGLSVFIIIVIIVIIVGAVVFGYRVYKRRQVNYTTVSRVEDNGKELQEIKITRSGSDPNFESNRNVRNEAKPLMLNDVEFREDGQKPPTPTPTPRTVHSFKVTPTLDKKLDENEVHEAGDSKDKRSDQ